ncbi:hypothetical protein FA13DRAFT_1085662 [Coprinellus micaceus]|uniref:Nephrocystin 3-like N-terminal domain-containing protein n=1 Tax=Coprinellus micaceus TaxID=71717 RepID=A0A4Y7TT74_COPMI|nr:hypothetical protein FA13DRAFT_1085662 [Coprinellus micaceus]
MNDARYQTSVPTEEDEEQAILGQVGMERGNVTYNYYGPVVGQASNANFGTNHGQFSLSDQRLIFYLAAPFASAVTIGVGLINQGIHYNSSPADPDSTNHTSRQGSVQQSLVHRSDLFTLLNPILDASHTRNMTVSPPNSACFPGTRLKVTKKVRSWMGGSLFFSNPHIMWIYGYAGCGKSAIAQEVARHFAVENRLAAAFFFFRGAGDRSRITRFATTVASQVAAAIPGTAPIIEMAIRANPALLQTKHTSLADQFRKPHLSSD